MRKLKNFATALLLSLLLVSVPRGESAVAQGLSDLFPGGARNLNFVFLHVFGAGELSRGEELKLQIQEHAKNARDGLREGDARKFYSNRALLKRDIREPGIGARNRILAKRLLAALPAKFVEGFAFQRNDGTVAADRDRFIQSQLVREGDPALNGGDTGDAD